MSDIWDQQQNEPDDAYARFTTYLTLGPTRSIVAAQAIHTGKPKATKGHKRPSVSGSWKNDAVTFNWVARADAWDAYRGLKAVEQSEHIVSQLYHDCVVKLLELARKRTPKNYMEFLEGFKVLMTAYDPIIQNYGAHRRTANEA